MTYEAFRASLTLPAPPPGLDPLREALWHEANGNWPRAHDIAQSREGTPAFDALHAYLHRVEGDRSNAVYWYRRAGRATFEGSLEAEWEALARES